MLVVKIEYRRNGLGSLLVKKFVSELKKLEVDEVSIETECVNIAALKLYESKSDQNP